jgi:hypothetical protein
MRLLIINPTERYHDMGIDIDPEISRIIELIRNTKEYLAGIDVVLESGAHLDFKLHRTLMGDARDQNGPDLTVRRIQYVPERFRTGDVLQVPQGKKKPVADEAMLVSLESGGDKVFVVGFLSDTHVLPTLQTLHTRLGGNLVVIQNCVGSPSPEAHGAFLESCKDLGISVSVSSDVVRAIWEMGH